jgi:redox-sensitive bicupin YhaK (pirin superfamily)
VGPVCFLDHFGPHAAVGSATSGVPPHPHIGLSTVTYLFEGETLHRDSLGTQQLIRPGDVNWMTAGRGIVHSERTPPAWRGRRQTTHGLQVWVALPLEAEEAEPSFQHASRDALPVVAGAGVRAAVVLGTWAGETSPIRVASPTLYVVAELEAGSSWTLAAEAPERALYVVEGRCEVGGEALREHQLAVLTPGAAPSVRAPEGARVAVLGGAPLEGPRFMWWNFVSSRTERLAQARDDWRQRRFPAIPGDAEDRVAMPGEQGV